MYVVKIEKFTDVCMTGGMHYTPSHPVPEMLKLGRVTKFKMLFLVLVFVFNLTYLNFRPPFWRRVY